jgi:D-sedoheptulose 7-phosphate isomerase
MNLEAVIQQEFLEAQSVLQAFNREPKNFQNIAQAATLMAESLRNGGKILSCGNGGSHCDAMHFAEELTGKYRNPRRSLAAIAISDPTYMSCVGNDYGYDQVFSRFIEGVGRPGDVLLAISTSGNSENIIRAVEAARQQNMKVVILSGKDGGKLRGKGDVEICVPHFGYADRIQEVHIKVIHNLILGIERLLTDTE